MEIEERKEEENIKGECLLSGKVTFTTIDNVKEIVIQKDGNNQTYLSDVLDRLPYGLVSKEETGMGATSLELQTPRNSIIVEPIKITASSKAHSHTKSPTDKVLYVGSETMFHKKITNASIAAYVNNPKIKHKKIIVVADSLYRVVDAIGNKVFKDYFLLLDEVDSFQMDSTFRRSMDECIEYYKKFDKNKRCMLSATLVDFSDPDLNNEEKTVIKYDKVTPRKIEIVKSSTPELIGNATDKIKDLLLFYPNDKIMVAFNSVKGSNEIATYLTTEGILKTEDIKILCGKSNKDKIKTFYSELDSDKLPSRLNFVTSAYFSGFDLKEKYHLISVSGNKNAVHSLSDKRLKQIAGRCRIKDGVLTETVIHDLAHFEDDYILPDKESLKEAAQAQIDSLVCIEKHYSKNPILKKIHSTICDQILKTLESQDSRFIKKVKSSYGISYLNIDAYLENSKTRFELYKEDNLLFDKLQSQQHLVSSQSLSSKTLVPTIDVDTIDRKAKLQEIINVLRLNPDETSLQVLLNEGDLEDFQKKIVENYRELYRYIDNNDLLDKIEEAADSRDSRKLNNLILSARFSIMAPGDAYKRGMRHYFPIGIKLTTDEILKRVNTVFIENNIPTNIDTNTKAIKFIKTHFTLSGKSRKDGTFKIKDENPYKLVIQKVKKEAIDMSRFSADLLSWS